MELAQKTSLHRLTLSALLSAIIAVSAWITIPGPVPFTMQTAAVFLTALLLGTKYGLLSVSVYLTLGAVGVPIFSGFHGGIAVLIGPTGGYLIGFLLMVPVIGYFRRFLWKKPVLTFVGLFCGLLLCYLFGTVQFLLVAVSKGNTASLLTVLTNCVFPFILPDLGKALLALLLSRRLVRLLPDFRI